MIHFFCTAVSVNPNNFSRKEVRVIPNSAFPSCIEAPKRKDRKGEIYIDVSKFLYSITKNDFDGEKFESYA